MHSPHFLLIPLHQAVYRVVRVSVWEVLHPPQEQLEHIKMLECGCGWGELRAAFGVSCLYLGKVNERSPRSAAYRFILLGNHSPHVDIVCVCSHSLQCYLPCDGSHQRDVTCLRNKVTYFLYIVPWRSETPRYRHPKERPEATAALQCNLGVEGIMFTSVISTWWMAFSALCLQCQCLSLRDTFTFTFFVKRIGWGKVYRQVNCLRVG